MRPQLLLLCGLLSDATAWADVAALLEGEAEVRIVAFDGCASIGEMAERALAAATSGRFAVAGHSMGGRVALEVFARAPERVERMALLNTGVHPAAASEAESRGRLVELARRRGMAALVEPWLLPMMSEAGRSDAALMARLKAMVARYSPEAFAGQIQALLERPDATPTLAALRVPTLLLTGDKDGWSGPAQHEAMQATLPTAQLVIVPGAGHFTAAEQPHVTARALSDWLRAA